MRVAGAADGEPVGVGDLRSTGSEAALRPVRGTDERDLEDPLAAQPKTGRNLLIAAKQLLSEEGSEALSLSAIAERSGENKAMIAYYFGDKAGFIEALLECVIHDCHLAFTVLVHDWCAGGHASGSPDAVGLTEASGAFRLLIQLLPHALRDEVLSERVAQLHELNAYLLVEYSGVARDPQGRLDPERVAWARLCCAATEGLVIQMAVNSESDFADACRALSRLFASASLRDESAM